MSKVDDILEKARMLLGHLEASAPYHQVMPLVRSLESDIRSEFGHLVSRAPADAHAPETPAVITTATTLAAPHVDVEEVSNETSVADESSDAEASVETDATTPSTKKSRTSAAKTE